MPYANPNKRRRWENSPDQKLKTADRQARHRERQEDLATLIVAYEFTQRVGREDCIGPILLQKVKANLPKIQKAIARRNRQPVEVWVDGKKVTAK